MPAGYQDLYMERGTTFTSQLTLTDNNGLPYNLNQFNVFSSAKSSYISDNVALQFTANVVNANSGILQLSANAATTANVVPNAVNKLVYDVIIQDTTGSGNITRVLEGQIFVSPSVSLPY